MGLESVGWVRKSRAEGLVGRVSVDVGSPKWSCAEEEAEGW